MKILLLTIFIIFTHFTWGQKNHLWGQVVNAETGEPLPYVNLVFEKEEKGTSTNEDGRFSIVLQEKMEDDRVQFTFVGFKNQVLEPDKLKGNLVKLVPLIDDLAEVEVYNITGKNRKNINSFKGSKTVGLGNFSGGEYPSMIARYYSRPGEFDKGCFIDRIKIRFFSTNEQLFLAAKFRLRVFAVNEDGEPGEDLLLQNLVIEKSRSQFVVTVPMQQYRIYVPANGFFIAVEHLFIKENRYREINDYVVNDTLFYKDVSVIKYAPVFTGILEDDNEQYSSYYKHVNGWKKMNKLDTSNKMFGGKIPAPAFEVRLTN